jgi:hypothetical protein
MFRAVLANAALLVARASQRADASTTLPFASGGISASGCGVDRTSREFIEGQHRTRVFRMEHGYWQEVTDEVAGGTVRRQGAIRS